MKPVLFTFSGLPGSGKSTLAREVAKYYQSAYLRLDTIEHGIKELCNYNVQGEGYRLSYRIAADNLVLGNSVVADCCNPWELTREEWESIAIKNSGICLNIEVICSDKNELRRRIETRKSDIVDFKLPDWNSVIMRKYEKWNKKVIRIDTALNSKYECIKELIESTKKRIEELS